MVHQQIKHLWASNLSHMCAVAYMVWTNFKQSFPQILSVMPEVHRFESTIHKSNNIHCHYLDIVFITSKWISHKYHKNLGHTYIVNKYFIHIWRGIGVLHFLPCLWIFVGSLFGGKQEFTCLQFARRNIKQISFYWMHSSFYMVQVIYTTNTNDLYELFFSFKFLIFFWYIRRGHCDMNPDLIKSISITKLLTNYYRATILTRLDCRCCDIIHRCSS